MYTHESHRRRGSMYILVLGIAVAVAVIGLSSLAVARIERRGNEGWDDFAQARNHAQAAIELGTAKIQADANWRSTYPNGVWEADRPIGDGQYTLTGTDPGDGNLADDAMDSLVLTGIGAQGDALHKRQVQLEAKVRPLTCLETALHAGTNIILSTGTVQCDQIISANNDITVSSGIVNSDMEAVGTILGTEYITGTDTSPVPARTMPDPDRVFDYYVSNGTPITLGALVGSLGCGLLDYCVSGVVLSPTSNPYGLVKNPEGIYVINCVGLNVTIRDSRIVGTLVLLNATGVCRTTGVVNWEPAVPNYPALLVAGNMSFQHTKLATLDEATIGGGTNFNPPGTPYNGQSDSDTLDVYPSVIKGLVYVSAKAVADLNHPAFEGVVVTGGAFKGSSNLSLTYRSTHFDDPPPGFKDTPAMKVVTGSWQRVVD